MNQETTLQETIVTNELPLRCNCETFVGGKGLVKCGAVATWRGSRWPEGLFCDHHKRMCDCFPTEWTRIAGTEE